MSDVPTKDKKSLSIYLTDRDKKIIAECRQKLAAKNEFPSISRIIRDALISFLKML